MRAVSDPEKKADRLKSNNSIIRITIGCAAIMVLFPD